MKAWNCKRSQAIVRAIAVASTPQIAADNDRRSAGVAKERLQLAQDAADRREQRRMIWQPGVADPEKLAAFQERTGMTKWGKKRG